MRVFGAPDHGELVASPQPGACCGVLARLRGPASISKMTSGCARLVIAAIAGGLPPRPADVCYLMSTRVPRIFCAVIEFKNDGSNRSINSKNDDKAGVCVFWL